MKRIGIAAVAAVLLACGMRNVERVPPQEADTARPATLLSKGELHSHMQALSAHAARVNQILRQPEPSATDRDEVVREMQAIGAIAKALSVEDARTVHPVLWRNIQKFRDDVDLATRLAQADPPNFFLAGTVAGSCSYCHGPDIGQVH